MMRMVITTFGAAALVAAFAGQEPNAEDFTFSFEPSELATGEGWDAAVARLEREARQHCERKDQSLRARRGERLCREATVARALETLIPHRDPSQQSSPTLKSEGDDERH